MDVQLTCPVMTFILLTIHFVTSVRIGKMISVLPVSRVGGSVPPLPHGSGITKITIYAFSSLMKGISFLIIDIIQVMF